MNPKNKGFTLIELLVVIVLITVLVSLISAAWLKARRTAEIIKAKAVIRSKLDDALIRRAIKARDYEFYRAQIERQIKTGMDLR